MNIIRRIHKTISRIDKVREPGEIKIRDDGTEYCQNELMFEYREGDKTINSLATMDVVIPLDPNARAYGDVITRYASHSEALEDIEGILARFMLNEKHLPDFINLSKNEACMERLRLHARAMSNEFRDNEDSRYVANIRNKDIGKNRIFMLSLIRDAYPAGVDGELFAIPIIHFSSIYQFAITQGKRAWAELKSAEERE